MVSWKDMILWPTGEMHETTKTSSGQEIPQRQTRGITGRLLVALINSILNACTSVTSPSQDAIPMLGTKQFQIRKTGIGPRYPKLWKQSILIRNPEALQNPGKACGKNKKTPGFVRFNDIAM